MIRVQPLNTESIYEPYYRLVYNYMIGDSKGYTTHVTTVSIENPYVERYVKLLNSLKPLKNHWGIILERNRLRQHLNENQISKDDYEFLNKLMFDEYDEETEETEEDDYAYQFCEGVMSETEYSFLVFEDVDLFYIDCFGIEYSTELIED